MVTYNDYLLINRENPEEVMEFVHRAITQHKSSTLYQEALIADQYARHKNVTITEYQKLLYTITGKAVPDNYSSNFKLASNFFNRFVTQENQFLLGNGITWKDKGTADKLGKDFDYMLQKAGKSALIGAVSFGFFNLDHMEVFNVLEFAPLYDEENGALMAGVRFWQVDDSKPLRATFYELDGYTNFIWDSKGDGFTDDKWQKVGEGKGMVPKMKYILKLRTSEIDGTEIYDGENYPTFPIVPLWANEYHQSEFTGLREQIDCYDLIKSGFANTVDEGSIIYWLVQNAGGMDNIDLVQFVEQIKTMHAAAVGDGSDNTRAEAHTIEPPYQSRESLLNRLRADLYEDAMALDIKNIADGAVTATQIKAAYNPLNLKTDEYEFRIIDFLTDILKLAGIEDEDPTFTRSMILNQAEDINSIVAASSNLSEEYVTRKLLTILGDGDMADEVLKQMKLLEMERNGFDTDEDEEEENEEAGSERAPESYEKPVTEVKIKEEKPRKEKDDGFEDVI